MSLPRFALVGTLASVLACGGNTANESSASRGTAGSSSLTGAGGSAGAALLGGAAGTDNGREVVCDPNAVYSGKISTCDANLDQLLGVTTLKGSLTLGSYWTDSGACPNVDTTALRCLERIEGELNVYDFIHSIADISNLREVTGDASLEQAYRLKNFDGLQGLRTVGGKLDLYNNFVDTIALGVETVGDRLTIGGRLKSLSLPALKSTGDFWIMSSDSLETLSGLESLTDVAGELSIYQNMALTNLHGLSGLTHSGSISVEANDILPACEIAWLIDHIGKSNIDGDVRIEMNDGDVPCTL